MPVTLTAEDIVIFRRIPKKTHKVKLFSSFSNSFTGLFLTKNMALYIYLTFYKKAKIV